jgi:hypothetical protein
VQALDYLLLFALLQVVNRLDCCPRITVTPKDKILKAQLSVSATVYVLIMRTQVSWRAYKGLTQDGGPCGGQPAAKNLLSMNRVRGADSERALGLKFAIFGL